MVINTNMAATTAASNLDASQAMLSKSLAKLSSGSKIVNPSDDAAGLAESMHLTSQIGRLNSAQSNVADAVSFTQTQDGYLSNISTALNRMSELSILSQDVTKTDSDRSLYNSEFQQLASYITSASNKGFNGVSLFSGNTLNVTVDSEGGTFAMTGIDLSAAAYTNATSANVSTTAGATTALASVEAAINQLASDRASIGAYQSRLNSTSSELSVSINNLTAANSAISDVDMAQESTNYQRENILVQSGTAMLAQANQMPQSVLRLLQ